MFEFILAATARSYYFLRRFMPTNIVIDAINTRRGLKWGVPAMLLAVPYRLAAVYCGGLVEGGGTGWLYVLVLLFVWNALKFLVVGPVSVMRLVSVRVRESRGRRSLKSSENVTPERVDEPELAERRR
ncbi:sulfate permease [Cryobacterium sp. Y82]|uniref:sulfate permease n=1 Tax=Cryobacterium sp. Y82 TaxID=2045017 RepID=UPI000CE52E08|nr:sulfate permease [Cryobacterium sp. Y82]